MTIVEKYRAESIQDLIISKKILEEINSWLNLWREGTPTKKALILYGPPGTGKTTTALVLAKEAGVPIIEMNASDTRNSDWMKRIALMASLYGDITYSDAGETKFNKIILVDEADNIFEGKSKDKGGDSGGLTELSRIVSRTNNPIILTMNDFYEFRRKPAAREIINNSLVVEFRQFKRKNDLDYRNFRNRLQERLSFIAKNEGLVFRPEITDRLLERNRDDIRAILNDAISMMSYRGDANSSAEAGIRDAVSGIYDVIHSTFKGRNYEMILSELMEKDFTTEDYLMWLDSNLPSETKDPSDMVSAYEILALADIFVGRVIKKQHYAFKGYAEEIAAGVFTAIKNVNDKYVKYEFPSYIMKMSRMRDGREGRRYLVSKLARLTHSGSSRVSSNLWFFQYLSKNRINLQEMQERLNLSEKELSILRKS